jgi:hypothetical protein
MKQAKRHLLVLGCSSTKLQAEGGLPAIDRYDGPTYRVLRSFLRESLWPSPLSIAVLSAKYGLIGGLTSIEHYDQRMDRNRAQELAGTSTETLVKWGKSHSQVSLLLGKEYLPALNLDRLSNDGVKSSVVEGPIGMKLNHLHNFLHGLRKIPRTSASNHSPTRPFYFLPDWDDMLDVNYDFKKDCFSSPSKAERDDQHCIRVMRPHRMCDGVLVSLAQHLGSKGVLRRFAPTDFESLAPQPIRKTFGLSSDQWAFGDCGAFSYVNERIPTITTEQAVSLYQIYGFDFGASVDHIPVPEITVNDKKRTLHKPERYERVKVTRDNAERFLELHKQRRCTFIPVGVIQGVTPLGYGRQLLEYVEMGYEHIGVGGLVPRSDAEIVEILTAIKKVTADLRHRPWIHLFGVFRPKIQAQIKEAGITSFDSATYFRKAWLRSGQNYLAVDGNWYAAVRVPMTSDPRTIKRLQQSGLPLEELKRLEESALKSLHRYAERRQSLDSTLDAIQRYDSILNRSDNHDNHEDDLLEAYRKTLVNRPWERCSCPVCSSLGIDVLIFRGCNRNKRRGAHNTLMLYRTRGEQHGTSRHAQHFAAEVRQAA